MPVNVNVLSYFIICKQSLTKKLVVPEPLPWQSLAEAVQRAQVAAAQSMVGYTAGTDQPSSGVKERTHCSDTKAHGCARAEPVGALETLKKVHRQSGAATSVTDQQPDVNPTDLCPKAPQIAHARSTGRRESSLSCQLVTTKSCAAKANARAAAAAAAAATATFKCNPLSAAADMQCADTMQCADISLSSNAVPDLAEQLGVSNSRQTRQDAADHVDILQPTISCNAPQRPLVADVPFLKPNCNAGRTNRINTQAKARRQSAGTAIEQAALHHQHMCRQPKHELDAESPPAKKVKHSLRQSASQPLTTPVTVCALSDTTNEHTQQQAAANCASGTVIVLLVPAVPVLMLIATPVALAISSHAQDLHAKCLNSGITPHCMVMAHQ